MKFTTRSFRPDRRASFIALITAVSLSELAFAQTPKLTSDGGGGGTGGGQQGPRPFHERLVSCNPSPTETRPSHKPLYVGAYTTVTPLTGSLKRYCVRPVLFNTAATISPDALNLWLTDHRMAMTSTNPPDSVLFSALKKSLQTTASCQVQMPAVPAANGGVNGSAISDTTWCFDSYLPQPTLGMYLGVPAVNVSIGSNNPNRMKTITPNANAKTFTTPTKPPLNPPPGPVPGSTYAAYCRLDFSPDALAPPPVTVLIGSTVQCAPVSNPRFRDDPAQVNPKIPGTRTPVAPEKSGGSPIDVSKKPPETRKP